jgi:maltooligosyltrehalose trehalohydrolase
LRELNDAVQRLARRLGRIVPVVAESDLNDRRVIDPVRKEGYGLAGQWSDDFHHCLHTLLTGERSGYYQDFGVPAQLAKAYTHGFVYDGQHSLYRGRQHGTVTKDVPAERFVIYAQNHDQVGNRAQGERLSSLVDFERLKLAATALLVSPCVPLLFMGEEYGERAPFRFFTDFQDSGLQTAVTRGRHEEFAALGWTGAVPDPQDPASFARSVLDWNLQSAEPHSWLWNYYRTLLDLRRRYPVLGVGGKRRLSAQAESQGVLTVIRKDRNGPRALALLNLSPEGLPAEAKVPRGQWHRLVDSGEERFGGVGPKTPEILDVPRMGRAQIDLAGWGAAIFLRRVTSPREREGVRTVLANRTPMDSEDSRRPPPQADGQWTQQAAKQPEVFDGDTDRPERCQRARTHPAPTRRGGQGPPDRPLPDDSKGVPRLGGLRDDARYQRVGR